MNSCPPFTVIVAHLRPVGAILAQRALLTLVYAPHYDCSLLCSLAIAFVMCFCFRGIWSSFCVRFVFVLVLSALLIGFRISSNQRRKLMGRVRCSYEMVLYLWWSIEDKTIEWWARLLRRLQLRRCLLMNFHIWIYEYIFFFWFACKWTVYVCTYMHMYLYIYVHISICIYTQNECIYIYKKIVVQLYFRLAHSNAFQLSLCVA